MNSDFLIKNPFSKFVEISGEDRAEFLQGLITNDIYKCKKDKPIYACLLSPQGKFLADFFITYQHDNYLIEIHEKFFSSFILKLETYKLRSKVNFLHNENYLSVILFSNKNYKIPDAIKNFNDPRNANIGKKIYILKKNLKNITQIKEESFEKYREILMKNLIPFSPNDLEENKSLLLENNIQNLNAIDWNKGCYVGQEITARMKYRALLKKQLYTLKMISGNLNIEDEIIINKNILGHVVSKVNNYILCVLKIELVNEIKKNEPIIELKKNTSLKFL